MEGSNPERMAYAPSRSNLRHCCGPEFQITKRQEIEPMQRVNDSWMVSPAPALEKYAQGPLAELWAPVI